MHGLNKKNTRQIKVLLHVLESECLSLPSLLPPMKYSWYSSPLEAESTPEAGRIISTTNSNDPIGNRAPDGPACSAVRQRTAPPRAGM
jgi:hypothetical protein